MKQRSNTVLVVLVALVAVLGGTRATAAAAKPLQQHRKQPASGGVKFNSSAVISATIHLPNGSKPKSMAFGNGTDLFISTLTGDVFHLNTAEHLDGSGGGGGGGSGSKPPAILAKEPGIALTGIAYDAQQHLLVAAGSVSGKAFVYLLSPARPYAVTRRLALPLARLRGWQAPYVNDVLIGPDHLYFSDSLAPLVHAVPRARYKLVEAAEAAAGGRAPPGVGFYKLSDGFKSTAARLNMNGLVFAADRTLLVSNFDGGYVARVDLPPGDVAVGRAASARVVASLPAFREGAGDPWPNVRPDCMVMGEAEGVVYLSDNFENR